MNFIKQDKLAAILKGLKGLSQRDVLVGVPDDKTDRKGEPITNATIGYINEHGSPAANIPARPHLIPGIDDAKDDITKYLKKAAVSALDGKTDKVTAALDAAGTKARDSVKNKITDGAFEPLKPATIANRFRQRQNDTMRDAEKEYLELIASGAQAAGFSLSEIEASAGIRPLVNTGQYRNSITYVIRKK